MNIKQLIIYLAIFLCVSPSHGQTSDVEKKPLDINSKNADAWKQHIRPTDQERAWTKIDWLPDLKSGIDAASKSGKPILLWTMNGHPFGCT